MTVIVRRGPDGTHAWSPQRYARTQPAESPVRHQRQECRAAILLQIQRDRAAARRQGLTGQPRAARQPSFGHTGMHWQHRAGLRTGYALPPPSNRQAGSEESAVPYDPTVGGMRRGEGGTVGDVSVAEVAQGVRRLLAAVDSGALSCSAAHRNRLQGAVVALEALVGERVTGRQAPDGGTASPD
jgi:hypothetical protein